MMQYFWVFLKGMAMGAADVVPGVSGGTIAFITGIYDRLLGAINGVNLSIFKKLKTDGLMGTWKALDATFVVFLLSGILSSVLILSAPITYALEYHPILIWSFFFGLVLASVWLVGRQIKEYNWKSLLFFILGAVFAYWITTLESLTGSSDNLYILMCGAIAICAMILPGVSGAFILLVLGVYKIVIEAIHDKNLTTLAFFAVGCIVGLLSFSRLLKWLLHTNRVQTLAVLTGFLLGSLNKIWPWKNRVGEEPLYLHSDGREEWLLTPVLPGSYVGEPQILAAFGLCLAGALLIIVMSRFEKQEA